MNTETTGDKEIEWLLEAIQRRCGYDFREYSDAFLRRRLARVGAVEHDGIRAYLRSLLGDDAALETFVRNQSIVVTTMFRDPEFFAALREHVVPLLRVHAAPRIWIAGCATGQEAYSTAIVLHEAGVLERCRIYATDFNVPALVTARAGTYGVGRMREYTDNYHRSGGREDFSDFFHVAYGHAVVKKPIRDRIVFSFHDLTTDPPIADVDIVLCRNVLIYFSTPLRGRVLDMFAASLTPDGVLATGDAENLDPLGAWSRFRGPARAANIYQAASRHAHATP